jgi:ADP-heptose:LPS heptosyltransferase
LPKVLVIRFSSIGDIVLTSPVIRCIKKQLLGATVHFLTKKVFLPVLEANPYIDKIYSIETDVKEIMDRLHSEEYDYIIDLHHNLRTLQVKKDLRRRSYSFPKLNIEKWLVVNLKIDRLPNIHIVDRYFETVKALNVNNDGQGLDHFIPIKDEVDINTLPESHRKGYIGIIIGAGHFTKQFPEHKLTSLCKKLNSPIVLLGGKEDAENAKRIEAAVGVNIFTACGKYSINQSASLVKQAKKIITNDTGLMHIASAFKKDIISIWGNTIPEFGMYPYMPGASSHIMEVKGLKCRPCSKLGYDACPKKHFKCMEQISEEQIIKNL